MDIPDGWDSATLDDSNWDAAEVVAVLDNITVSVRWMNQRKVKFQDYGWLVSHFSPNQMLT